MKYFRESTNLSYFRAQKCLKISWQNKVCLLFINGMQVIHSYELKITRYSMKSPVFDDIISFKVIDAKKYKHVL